MQRMLGRFVVILAVMAVATVRCDPVVDRFSPGERVLVLGDSITHFGHWWPYVWCGYAAQYPENPPVFINAGFSGDTATGALDRLDRDVFAEDPDVVCVMFGMNDMRRTLYTAGDSTRSKAERQAALHLYGESMDQLLGRITEKGIRCVVVTPSPYDQTLIHADARANNPGYNDGLALAARVSSELAEKYGCGLIDFHGPMTRMNQELQARNPAATLIGLDRIHPGDEGSRVMAELFLEAQGLPLDGLEDSAGFETVWEHVDFQRNILNIRWIEDRVLLRRGLDVQNVEAAKVFLTEEYKPRGGADRERVQSYLQWKGREDMLRSRLEDVRRRFVPFSVPGWLGDHMMLPADCPVPLCGRAAAGTVVTVEFMNRKKTAAADSSNHWKMVLDPMSASSKPRKLIVSAGQPAEIVDRQFADVLVGDIWLCSGQSNMQRRIVDSDEAGEAQVDILSVDVRYFNGSQWMTVNAKNVENVSAAGGFFAMEMARLQQAPVGIFVAARGGTGIEAWLPAHAFPDTEEGNRMKPLVNDRAVLNAAREDAEDFKPWGEHRLARWGLGRAVPSSLYEALVRPFGDLPVRGVVWYQGESNTGSMESAREYRLWLQNLIAAWRALWHRPDLPFIIIQLPAYNPGSPEGCQAWQTLQDVQAEVAQNTANAVLVDIRDLGDLDDIHPRRKKEVGVRAAEAACVLLDLPHGVQ